MASHTPPLRYCMAFGSLVEMLSGVNGARSGIDVESSAPWGLWGGGGANVGSRVRPGLRPARDRPFAILLFARA